MAESIRAVLAETDAVIARVRATIAGTHLAEPKVAGERGEFHDDFVTPVAISDETAAALRVADDWARRALAIIDESRMAETARDFRLRWPALVRWRDRVLANQQRQPAQTVAAAYESLALECLLADEYHLSARAQQAAIDVIRARGPKGSKAPSSVVPIRPAEPSVVAQSA